MTVGVQTTVQNTIYSRLVRLGPVILRACVEQNLTWKIIHYMTGEIFMPKLTGNLPSLCQARFKKKKQEEIKY